MHQFHPVGTWYFIFLIGDTVGTSVLAFGPWYDRLRHFAYPWAFFLIGDCIPMSLKQTKPNFCEFLAHSMVSGFCKIGIYWRLQCLVEWWWKSLNIVLWNSWEDDGDVFQMLYECWWNGYLHASEVWKFSWFVQVCQRTGEAEVWSNQVQPSMK